jgi:hypothetical protein
MSETFTAQSNKLTFSGHDTFHCRQLWLKKGYDFVKNGNKFMDIEAVVLLGVGKNMVSIPMHLDLKKHFFCTKSHTKNLPLF